MSTARKILSNTASQVIGKVITALLGIIGVKLITNYLSASAYGEYTAIYDYTAIFAIIADFGLFTIAVREMAHDTAKIPYILGNVLSVRTFLGLGALSLGILIAFFIPAYSASMIPVGIVIVSISTLLTLMAGTVSSVLQIHLKMQRAALALITGKAVTIAYIAATILWLYPNDPAGGFLHLLYSWIFGTAVTILLTYIPSRRLAKIAYRFDIAFWKEVIFKALPYGAALLLGSMYFRTGSVLMSFFGQKESVGIYGVAIRIIEISVIIPAYFMNSILPILTRALKESRERVHKIMQYAFDFMALSALPALFGGAVLAKPFIAAVSNDKFLSHGGALGSDFVLSVLMIGMTFTYFHNVFGYALVAMARQSKVLLINFFAALLNITANVILIPKFSFPAVSCVAVITEMFIFFCGLYFVNKFIGFKPKVGILVRAFFASILMAAVIGFLDEPMRKAMALKSLFILIPVGALFYFATLVFMKTFTKEMVQMLFKKEEKGEEEVTMMTGGV